MAEHSEFFYKMHGGTNTHIMTRFPKGRALISHTQFLYTCCTFHYGEHCRGVFDRQQVR